ncbi:MAG: glycerophosphodiester phosphodiesterase [Xenococcaceae cyanobacterium MO_188.B32]|nr:glycerophosphodiester phosphodiesterase [Xenococcaceae cyanobacterium MO_188.B32]
MIVAHRGFADNCRENTLESYRRAIEVGADAIELDVRKTKDDISILFHDELIGEKRINRLTYEEINHLARDLRFQVPTLVEVLKLVQGKIKLDVELKEKDYEIDVITQILEYLTIEQFIVTSFQLESLLTIKLNYPQVKTGIILNSKTASNFNCNVNLIAWDFLILQFELLNKFWLDIARINNKSIWVWTVNEEKIIKKFLKDRRVAGIITDKSDLAVHLIKQLRNRHLT